MSLMHSFHCVCEVYISFSHCVRQFECPLHQSSVPSCGAFSHESRFEIAMTNCNSDI